MDEIKIGDTVHLRGITRHGKNRVKQYGSVWVVKNIRNGTSFLLETPDKKDMRWVGRQDMNFVMTAIQLEIFLKEN